MRGGTPQSHNKSRQAFFGLNKAEERQSSDFVTKADTFLPTMPMNSIR
jgi:hypothetical protein